MGINFHISIKELEKIYSPLKQKLKFNKKSIHIGILNKSKDEIYKIIKFIDYLANEAELNWAWSAGNKIIIGAYLNKKPIGLLWIIIYADLVAKYYLIRVKKEFRKKGIGTALEIFSFALLRYLYKRGEVEKISFYDPNKKSVERFIEYGWPPGWDWVTPIKVKDAFSWMENTLNLKELDKYLEKMG